MTTKEFNDNLKSLGISRREFAEMTGLHYGTVSNWHDENKPIPSWVDSWIKNYKKAKTLDVIVDAIEAVKCDCDK